MAQRRNNGSGRPPSHGEGDPRGDARPSRKDRSQARANAGPTSAHTHRDANRARSEARARRAGAAKPGAHVVPTRAPDGSFQVQLTRNGADRWKSGQPWIYRADLEGEPEKELQGGEVVKVLDGRGWFLGQAFYSRESKISLRFLTYEDRPIDAAFFQERIERSDALRRAIFPGETTYRLIHGEADGIPGLVVDRYGDLLSAQFLTKATESRKELLADLLMKHFNAKGFVERSDVPVRRLEGLEPHKGVLRGAVSGPVPYREGHILLHADLLEGQKTGTFLDQRENHVMSSAYARGDALDCFSYVGGFALQLATRAKSVIAVEISDVAALQLKANAAANKLDNVEVITANAFDYLRDALDEGKRFDTIVLDPPSFAKNKDSIPGALRGYKEINLRAMQLLRPGGVLITASCTYHVSEEMFDEMLASAAADAKRKFQVVERRGASRDHPALLGLRESKYLKCWVLRLS